MKSTLEKNYREFWKPIIERKDGSIKLSQLKKELYDYSMVMDIASKVYCTITNGRISKPNTHADVIIDVAIDEMERSCKQALIYRFQEVLDKSDNNNRLASIELFIEELKKEIPSR